MDLRSQALELWLKRLLLRSDLTAADCDTVRGLSGRTVTYGTSRDVVKLGERVTHCCLVADGLAARFGQTSEGLRQLTAFYIPGDMADLHSAVLPRISAPIQSASRATVVFVPHDEIIRAAAASPTLGRALWRDCVVDAQIASEWLLNNGRRNARSRLAHLLCEFATRHAMAGGERDNFPLELTQTHLADATGLTPVHVNRSLRLLRDMGAIEIKERRGVVLDWHALARTGDFDPMYLHCKG